MRPSASSSTGSTSADPAQILDRYSRFLNPSWAKLAKFMGMEAVEDRAEGCLIWDSKGREYLDCMAGPGVVTIGHRHPKVLAAVRDQLDRMPLSSKLLLNAPQAELAERLAGLTPGDLQFSFFCNSGAEAVEGALKAARMHAGRPNFVAAQDGFHGKTLGALSASGRPQYRQPFEPLLQGFTHVPFGDAGALGDAVDSRTAAVILEPIQAEGGINLPPPGYLQAARSICDRSGALLILDEVQTGLARTGEWFECNAHSVVPDLMCLGKALGGGVMPIGAFVARPSCWSLFDKNPILHTSTFGGNPLACRAALAALEVIQQEKLCDRARDRGAELMAGLRRIAQEHPGCIADVRGKGLLIGVEFPSSDLGGLAVAGLIARGVLVATTLNNPRVIRFEPPAVIMTEQIGEVCSRFRAVMEDIESVAEELKA